MSEGRCASTGVNRMAALTRALTWPTVRRFRCRYELRLTAVEFLDRDLLDPKEEAKGREIHFADSRSAEDFLLDLMRDYTTREALKEFATRELHDWFRLYSHGDEELARSIAWTIREGYVRVVELADDHGDGDVKENAS